MNASHEAGGAAAPAEPIAVPHGELSPEALRGVIEAFVLREGTEYGSREVELDTKVDEVLRQLDRGEAAIVFDPETESIDIVATRARGTRR